MLPLPNRVPWSDRLRDMGWFPGSAATGGRRPSRAGRGGNRVMEHPGTYTHHFWSRAYRESLKPARLSTGERLKRPGADIVDSTIPCAWLLV